MREDRPRIEAAGGPLTGYLAAPDTWPAAPAVVVIQEWWGLTRHIEDVCRRLAREGFAGLAPDLYRGRQTSEPDEARRLAMELDRKGALEDLRGAVTWLLQRGAESVGVLGFCMGGSLTWELAMEDDRVRAAVPFYGLADIRGRALHATVRAHFGTADRHPPALLDDVRRELEQRRAGHRLYLYEGAPHAFFNDTASSYRPEAATLAWERTMEFLRDELGSILR